MSIEPGLHKFCLELLREGILFGKGNTVKVVLPKKSMHRLIVKVCRYEDISQMDLSAPIKFVLPTALGTIEISEKL
jgi:hypothetical protein